MFFTKFIISIVLIYLLLLIFLYFYQGKLLYHPNVNSYTEVNDLIPKIEKVTIATSDNHHLLGWFHKKDISKNTILFFHGNAGSLENRIYKLNHFENFDLNFLILAWRGFSGNSGKPNEKGLYDDAKSAVSWLKSAGIKEEKIILYGESLGTAVAIEIAQNKKFAGIVLESPFTSMVEMGKKYYSFFPVSLLLKDRYESINKIKNINIPILVMHGKKDRIVPFEMGNKIYDSANSPKFYYFPDYDDHMIDYNKLLIEKLKSFIESLN
ncbi:MAG: alpha/beta hydrolase [Pelagibacteraceae bacterium]|nr:alpha/beta hydrolase [Pelagibacteraceae bacterium]